MWHGWELTREIRRVTRYRWKREIMRVQFASDMDIAICVESAGKLSAKPRVDSLYLPDTADSSEPKKPLAVFPLLYQASPPHHSCYHFHVYFPLVYIHRYAPFWRNLLVCLVPSDPPFPVHWDLSSPSRPLFALLLAVLLCSAVPLFYQTSTRTNLLIDTSTAQTSSPPPVHARVALSDPPGHQAVRSNIPPYTPDRSRSIDAVPLPMIYTKRNASPMLL